MLGRNPGLTLLCFLFHLAANAEEADPFTADPQPIAKPVGQDHLQPLGNDDQEWHRSYLAKLDAKLKPRDFAFARMMCRPSFEGESLVFIHGQEEDREFEKTEKFQVTARVAQTSIWYSLPDNGGEKQDEEVKVSVSTASLEKARALRLIKVWNQMLERTRQPDEDTAGLDGVTFEFSVPGKVGEVWTPSSEVSPGMLADIGMSLQKYAASKADERDALSKDLDDKISRLEKYLAGHPPGK